MKKRVLTKSAKETQRLAGCIFRELAKLSGRGRAAVIGFSGELGAGKTTLIQGLARALGIKEKIQSPTFVLMKIYVLPRTGKLPWKFMVHADVYRIEQKKEILALGLERILKDPANLVVIEWAERIKKYLPKNTLWVELKHKGGNHRHVIVKSKIKKQK